MISDYERRIHFEAVAAEVFEPLQRFLRRRVTPDDADEALGDTLLTIWRRLDDVPDQAVLPWSYGVARRILANQQRGSRRRRDLMNRVIALDPPGIVPDPSDREDHPALAAALAGLAEQDREVLVLWAWEELEPREIAVVLGASVNAVTLRLSRAKKRLAREMGGQNRASVGHKWDEHIEDQT